MPAPRTVVAAIATLVWAPACASGPADAASTDGVPSEGTTGSPSSSAATSPGDADATTASTPTTATSTSGDDGPTGDTGMDPGPFEPHPMFAELGDESVLDLGPFTCLPVPGEEPELCKRTTDYSGFVYDHHRHQMLLFGGGHATTMTDAIHAFDLATTLTWSDLYPPTACDQMTVGNLDAAAGAWTMGRGPYPRPVSSHTYDMLAVAPGLDEFIVISRNFTGGYCNAVGNDIGGTIAHFDRAAQTWSFSPTASGSSYDLAVNLPGSEPDPISGTIVLFGGGGLASYDPVTRVYTQHVDTASGESGNLGDLSGIGYANHMVYFPPDDRFYLIARDPGLVFSLAFDRDAPEQSIVERVATQGDAPGGEHGFDYDSTNHIIGGAVENDEFHVFDPATRQWSVHPMQGGSPGRSAFHSLAYDPVNNVFVFVTDYDSGARTWAYRLAN